ncbi:DUF2851 family protein [Chryseobacterium profundimaris]|uniref:DUF2851 domain-containing protein n=1 Tax=Chryseobacterium profundimaris TaxID=1387275 RepID=A0ABY1NVK6_9FLAO|nr:DUF2851 family protein [Chryseobacterium profundimaris]SMP19201.1 Protein of unknown function [Chryseobacterium profundimaris]
MTEKLLQYLWNHKIFKHFDFRDMGGNPVEIIDFGKWNTDSGPDFLEAKIKVGGVILAGHIELHIKSSDWIFHNHSQDPNYQNIILHAVYEHDMDIDELNNKNIPTLELKHHIDEGMLWKYEKLLNGNHFIACESSFDPKHIPVGFHEQNILKKLNEKAEELEKKLKKFNNNFEAVLFHSLAYSFGLKINAEIFRQIAEGIDFSIVLKVRQNKTQLEALLFGIAGWLEDPKDEAIKIWKREFDFLKAKFKISDVRIHPKFLRLRPPNFPTLRLSQLADLYHRHQNLFSKVIHAKSAEELFSLFKEIKASEYWDNHFNFGKISTVHQPKVLSKDFVELIILNTILPLKYTYHRYHNEEITEELLAFYKNLPPEKNSVIDSWSKMNIKILSSLESQSLIYHFNHFCVQKNCLHCSIGFTLLKES